jgi:hypothetical protein
VLAYCLCQLTIAWPPAVEVVPVPLVVDGAGVTQRGAALRRGGAGPGLEGVLPAHTAL